MKLHIYTSFVFLFWISSVIGQQQLTIEEAVLGQFRQFAPENIDGLQWIKDSDTYMNINENAVFVSGVAAKSKTEKLFGLDELNTWKGGKPLKAIPTLTWLTSQSFYFEFENTIYECHPKNKEVKEVCSYAETAENNDYHSFTKRMAYTKENNLWVQVGDKAIQLTHNEKDVVSGQSISRNEYGISKGTFWNNDGSKIAFYQKDETHVSNYPLTNYSKIPATIKEIKYPFAGMPSEQVTVGVYDFASGKTIFLKPKNADTDQFYLTNLSWGLDNKTIYLAWLNRKTTDMRFIAFDSSTGEEIKTLFTEHNDKWMEPQNPAIFLPAKSNQFVWMSNRDGFMSNRDGFTNTYLYTTEGKLLGNTKFKFEITDVLGFDKKNDNMFVMATGENATNSVCYKVSLKDMSTTLLTTTSGVHSVQVSCSGNYLIDKYSNLTVPNRIELIDAKGKSIKNLLTSKNPYEQKLIGQTELFTIKAADGADLWCRLIKPSNFDASKKYPVVVYVYNGPHVQLVTNNFLGGSSLWMNYLAEKGYLVFTLDGHGSAHRGRDFEQVIHRQLGTQEIEDQMLGVEWLKKQSFVDEDRMAVHGWSYGGFMTTSLMLRKPGTFKVGVAGGPVVDWALYEVMYGERYMDTPTLYGHTGRKSGWI